MKMSRLIDADELRNGLFHGYVEGKTDLTEREMGYQAGWNDALMYGVADAPTVDAVEVVRCKDCKWWHDVGCAIHIVDESDEPKDDDYCSFGERREDGKVG